jgi:hypothetical protein
MSFCLTTSFFHIDDDHTLKKMECGTMIGKLTNRMEDQSMESQNTTIDFYPFACASVLSLSLTHTHIAQAFHDKPCDQVAIFQLSSFIIESMQIHALP